MSDLTENVGCLSLRSLRARNPSQKIEDAADDDEEEEIELPPRPPRTANSKNPKGHRLHAKDQYYTPRGATVALLRKIGGYIHKVYTGMYYCFFIF